MKPLPDFCETALKEWAGVCRALAEGRQTVLARKGGILEKDGRFIPEYPYFWLYPTFVHQAEQGLREPLPEQDKISPSPHDAVRIDSLASVEQVAYVTSEADLAALDAFHIWTTDTIQRRFHYRRPGLWVLGVRVFRSHEPWTLVPTAEQLGCQSWVTLEKPKNTAGLQPVLDDAANQERQAELKIVLDGLRGTGS